MPTHRSQLCLPLILALAGPATAAPVLPDFSMANFAPGAAIDNRYFPIPFAGSGVSVALGMDADGPFGERSVLVPAGAGPEILGVQTTALLDRAFEDGVLVEETLDYYAQDSAGDVWYFGEDVTNFRYDDDGNFLGTDNASAWRGGVDGALPGWIMPADPVVGLSYYQEFAELNDALDQAMVLALGETVDLGFASFSDVLVTFETTELDTTARELKYYAPGYGVIRVEEGVDGAYGNPSLTFNLQPAAVPLPAALPLLLAALAGLAALRRRRG